MRARVKEGITPETYSSHQVYFAREMADYIGEYIEVEKRETYRYSGEGWSWDIEWLEISELKDIVFEVKVKNVTNKYGTVQVGKVIQVKLQDNNILIQQGGNPNMYPFECVEFIKKIEE